MHVVRSITLIFALLLQALPAAWANHEEPAATACSMSCCARSHATESAGCGCVDSQDEGSKPEPASAPPANGRERLTQTQWVAIAEAFALDSDKPFMSAVVSAEVEAAQPEWLRPQVRLSVLFCSFLT